MMKPKDDRTARRISLLGSALLLLVLTVLINSVRAEQSKTLRRGDKVIVQTDVLKALPTRHTSNLRVFSSHHGKLEPIAYRFFSRSKNGITDSTGHGDFFLDDDDELVFSAKDTGDRVTGAAFPLDCDAVMELSVSDPVSGETGWAYVLHFPGRPARLPWDRTGRNDKI